MPKKAEDYFLIRQEWAIKSGNSEGNIFFESDQNSEIETDSWTKTDSEKESDTA